MTFAELYKEYLKLKRNIPGYRWGQHICNRLDMELPGLWEAEGDVATSMLCDHIEQYHWNYNNLPVKETK